MLDTAVPSDPKNTEIASNRRLFGRPRDRVAASDPGILATANGLAYGITVVVSFLGSMVHYRQWRHKTS